MAMNLRLDDEDSALLKALAEAAPLLVADNVQGYMTKVALLLRPPPPKPARTDKQGADGQGADKAAASGQKDEI